MNKTYFAPTTSEVKFAGNSCILKGSSTIPEGNPADPGTPGIGPSAPARKLYV